MYLLGLDLGSTVCKSGIFDPKGRPVNISRREFSEALSSPQHDWIELDSELFWRIIAENVKNNIQAAHISPNSIGALSVSASGELFIPTSRNGNPVGRAIYWSDKRDMGYQRELQEIRRFGASHIYRITGYPVNPMSSLPKILWMKRNKPGLLRKIYKILLLEDFINFKLTGNCVTDHSLAMTSQMFDIRKKRWSSEIIEGMEIDSDILPEVVPSGKIAGEVQSSASAITGLARGTPVATGGLDQSCGALGIGVMDKGEAFNTTGTCEIVAVVSDRPTLNVRALRSGILCCPHVVQGKYLPLGVLPSSGSTLRWFRDNFGELETKEAAQRGQDAYTVLIKKAERSKAGSGGLFMLPHFDGSGSGPEPVFNTMSKGMFVGLTLVTNKGDFVRAIMEGITFEARSYFDSLKSLGLDASRVKVMGGGTKSRMWLQIKADILRKQIVLPNVTEGPSLGAAMLAGFSCGAYPSLRKAAKEICKCKTVIKPNRRTAVTYDRCYSVYKEIYPRLHHTFGLMAKVRIS